MSVSGDDIDLIEKKWDFCYAEGLADEACFLQLDVRLATKDGRDDFWWEVHCGRVIRLGVRISVLAWCESDARWPICIHNGKVGRQE